MLRELGNKVKKLEKLDSVDILYEVHEAAEELQKKIDRKSYLLVNSECWEIRKPKRPQNFHDIITAEANDLSDCYSKSLSETIIDVKSLQSSKSWNGRNLNIDAGRIISSDAAEPENDDDEEDDESKTYASASALSLATFASLLIEFVARLQNLVDAFEELSKKANFSEPSPPPPPPPPPVNFPETVEQVGFWTRLLRPFKS